MRTAAPWAALAALAVAAPLGAQGICDGRPIRSIRIDARTVFSEDDSLIPPFIRTLGNALHWQTTEETVRRDLLFAVGEPCDLLRLAETARLLRARPYVRSALVVPLADSAGGVDIVVQTRDEFSLEVRVSTPGTDGLPFRRISVTEDNLLGRGLRLQGIYDNFGRRAAFYGAWLDHHLFGRRIEAELTAGKSEVGPVGEETVQSAFESEFDRLAWRESARYRDEPFPLVSTTLGAVLEPLVATGGDVGVAGRFGRPGELQIVGAVLSAERVRVEGPPLASTPDLDSAAAAAVAGRFQEQRHLRLHAILGARRLVFHPHRGLDAVHGVEDFPEGAQGGLVLGKSLIGGSGWQQDWFSAGEYLVGRELGRGGLIFSRAKIEGRYLASAGRWDGVLADGELLVYDIGPRATLLLGARAAGGWDTETPFQLLMGGTDGLRGYGSATLPVGRRVVLNAEDRYYLGSVFGFADVGAVAFAETGRGWAGDALFGVNTGMLSSVGVGLRVASPVGSRRVYRLDLAMPLNRGLGPELRLAIGQQIGIANGEPRDVVRSRERISSVTVFDFPRF